LRLAAARRLGCRLRSLDPETGYLWEVVRGGISRILYGGLSPLNDALAAAIATDKFHAATLLARAGYRVPRSARCLQPGRFAAEEFVALTGTAPAHALAAELGAPWIVKPGHGARGRDVMAIYDLAALDQAVARVWRDDYLALVQETVAGVDLRIDLLDGACLIAYLRRPLRLRADGRRSVQALLERKGAAAQAAATGIDPSAIAPAGTEIEVPGPVLNLNTAAIAEVIALPAAWLEHARGIARALALRHCGIDLKIPALASDPASATVIEVNASTSLQQIALRGHRQAALAGEEKVVEAIFASP